MQSSARRHVEIETLEDFDRRVAQGATSMTGWQLQDVDLRKRGDVLERLACAEADFFLAEEEARAAEVRHGDGEADTRAQGRFFEDHRKRFAGEDRVVLAGLAVLLLQAE